MASPVTLFKTPEKITEGISLAGQKKAKLPLIPGFLKGILAGVFLAFGCSFALTAAGNAPASCNKILLGAVFPVGLCLIVLTGMELYTGNTMFMTVALLDKKIKVKDLCINWISSFIGNFIGSLLVSYFLVYLADITLTSGPWGEFTRNVALSKINNSWGDNFLRSIACNMLVNLALFIANSAEDTLSKIVCIFLPIFCFVTTGFEHSIANMFFIPTGLFLGIDASWGKFLYNNLLPVTLGNTIGGAIFIGAAFWYLYIYCNKSKAAPAPALDGEMLFTVESKN